MARRTVDLTLVPGDAARISWAGITRRSATDPPLDRCGWMPEKTERIDRIFRQSTLMVILSGRGSLTWCGRSVPLVGPCAVLLRPGEHAAYGPRGSWDEGFVVWGGGEAVLARLGLADLGGPLALPAPRLAARWIALLLELGRAPALPGAAEQADRAAAGLALGLRLRGPGRLPLGPAQRIAEAAAALRRNLASAPDLAGLARRSGFSAAQFRRAFAARLGLPPAAWLARERQLEAQRLLEEGDAPVRAVAAAVGFPDRRHFSRWFLRRCGRTPGQWRASPP